jgi:hypothetical protein
LTFITSGLIVAFDQAAPILNQTANAFHENSTYQNIPINLGHNLYNFNTYLPLIFYFVMMAIIFSTVLINSDPLSWLVGVIYIPFIYFVSVYISNAAHTLLTTPAIAGGVAHLPAPLVILANLPTVTFLFGLLYIVALALRIWFFPTNYRAPQH